MNSLWKSSGFLSKKPLLPYHQLKIQTWWVREADTPFYSVSCTRLAAQLSIIDVVGKVLLEASGWYDASAFHFLRRPSFKHGGAWCFVGLNFVLVR